MATIKLLRTQNFTRQYGGLIAVNDVNFNLFEGGIHAIIGPNGAGKTTLVSLICGRAIPSSGRIYFKGKDITSMSSAKRVQEGIVYTFQVTSIFGNLSCCPCFAPFGTFNVSRVFLRRTPRFVQ